MTRLGFAILLLLLADPARAKAPLVKTTRAKATVWMQIQETVVPLRENTTRNALILGFARKGQVLAVETLGQNWVKVRVNDSLSGWVPIASVEASGPPVNWDPGFVRAVMGVVAGTGLLIFLFLGARTYWRRRSETGAHSRQALVDAKRRLQNKIQLLFRGEPRIASHLLMSETDVLEFLRNMGYVANLERDPDHFLAACKAFKPNLILASSDFGSQVESLVETDAMLINTPVVYLRCEEMPVSPENRIRAYLDPMATDRELGEAISLCLRKSPRKIRYSVKPVALKGNVQSGTLVELLHFIAAVRKTGQLLVASPHHDGEILFQEGAIVRARLKEHTGRRATEEILNMVSGSFEFHEMGLPPAKTAGMSGVADTVGVAGALGAAGINTQQLLLDWTRNRDERNHHIGP